MPEPEYDFVQNFVCLTIRFKTQITPYVSGGGGLNGGIRGGLNGGLNDGQNMPRSARKESGYGIYHVMMRGTRALLSDR